MQGAPPPVPYETTAASGMPMLILFILIGIGVGYGWKSINNNIATKPRIFVGVIGSFLGGIIGYMTGHPLFLIITPIIGSAASLFFWGQNKRN